VKLLHGFEGMSLATFEAAKQRGLSLVLDAASAYERHVEAQVVEGEESPHMDPMRIRRERELADWIVAPSQYVVDCLLDNGVDPAKIVVIPYGVDCDQFVPRSPVRTGPFRVLFLGTVSPSKGLRYLLEAWRALNLPESELLLVGSPSKTGGQLLVEFDGIYRWLPQVPKHAAADAIAESDVVVLPSLSDGWGLVVGEALASGVPVITTTTTGFPVRPGVDGFVIPPRSAGELARTIGLLHSNHARRRRMGASGRAYVLNHFTWRHYRKRLAETYCALLADETPPGLVRATRSTELEQPHKFGCEVPELLSRAEASS
jgi:glycosyltransferase involved in cell wall biosynthesis